MEPECASSIIDASRDYIYTGEDENCFPVCFTCGVYSPFMIYLGNNEKSIKFQPHAGRIQLFCPVCTPDADLFKTNFPGEQLYRADSILNDRKFLDLLNRYKYSNPFYELYCTVDRIIITENSKLCARYKCVAKRQLPKSVKMKLLMNLFPAAHRLPNKKYTSTEDLCERLKEKYHEICVNYMNLSVAGGSQLLDNWDIMVHRTPMGERQTSRQTVSFHKMQSNNEPVVANLSGSSIANDMLHDSDQEMRASSDSDDELASIASGGTNSIVPSSQSQTRMHSSENISSQSVDQSVSGEIIISSLSADHSEVPSSQSQTGMHSSENISSQSVDQSVAAEITISSSSVDHPAVVPSSQSQTGMHSSENISSQSVDQSVAAEIMIDDSDDDDSGTVIIFREPRTVPRQSPTANDGQQAGPSHVERRRVNRRRERPMNPTPQSVPDDPLGRLPRFGGG